MHLADNEMMVTIQVDCQVRSVVPKGGRSKALTLAETELHMHFAEFSRTLEEHGYDSLFRINQRPVRRAPDRRMSPIDFEMPVNEDGLQYERRWDKRQELQDELHQLRELLAKPPVEGNVNVGQIRLRLSEIESLLREPPA